MKELNPHVFGDFAAVSLKGELKGAYNGEDATGTLQGVDFFIKRDGRWQSVYSQNTVTIP